MKKSWMVTFAILLAASVAVFAVSRRGKVQVVETRLETLPYDLDGRKGTDDKFDDGVYKVLNADANFLRKYERPDGNVLWLYIGYYGTQKGGRTGHMPQYCYPGSGWNIDAISKVPVTNGGRGPAEVNSIVVSKGSVKTLALYWNHAAGDRVLDTGLKMNITRFLRRVRDNRDDGAFVRISGLVVNDDMDKAVAEQKQFAEELLKVLPDHWPVEKDLKLH